MPLKQENKDTKQGRTTLLHDVTQSRWDRPKKKKKRQISLLMIKIIQFKID